MKYLAILAAIILGACGSSSRIVVRGGAIDSARAHSITTLLQGTEVDVILRSGAIATQTVRNAESVTLTPKAVLATRGADTVTIPLEYVLQLRGTIPRSSSRLAVGGIAGLGLGTVAGMIFSAPTPLAVGIGGAVAGITTAALLSQGIVVTFEHVEPAPQQR